MILLYSYKLIPESLPFVLDMVIHTSGLMLFIWLSYKSLKLEKEEENASDLIDYALVLLLLVFIILFLKNIISP